MPASTPTDWRYVLVAGVVGGLVAWLIAATFPGYLDKQPSILLDVGKYLLAGGLAATAGVYVLANTDTTQFPRTITFAAICGLSWSAVVEATSGIVKITADRAVAAAGVEAKKKQEALTSSTTTTPEAVKATVASTEVAAEKAVSAATPEVASQVIDVAKINIRTLTQLSHSAQNADVKAAARQGLESIASSPNIATEVKQAAKSSLALPQ
ncbi:hypothetical protein DES53_11834 [Roseimicrobium gellanilyticum]|uniref:Uncharacterized protein n=1 Tax=Roseimicrobium gellanilyticum TaxID=748857 RepID=A0A366H2S6_9BACT|nr:hypothetical protein [Roseimicrobium gellanilyticum]RBP36085.1 hypothetical protein DES53_11834 [Roseimicrobium gellanilyticum]